jgi:hypothetical protein
MKKLKLIPILGLLFFFMARAEEPGGHFVCDGVIEPGLSVDVTSVEVCPGDQGSVEVDTVTSEGTKYGHYEDTDEQVSFGLSLTDVQVTEPQVFEAPDRYTAFWIKHDTINMSGQYEDCGGGTVIVKDYDMGTVQMKNCNTKKTKGPKGSTGGGGGGGGGGGPKEEEKKEGECEEPAQPDQGVAEFFGGEEAWIVWPAPKDEEDKESMWFVATHRIVTINTPKARDLKGTIKLNKVSGDESCAKWLVVNDNVESPYSFGQAIPIVEPGHEGCGVHDWHGGEQFFGLIPEKPGEVVLESEVDPEQGSPTKKAQLKIAIVETDLDIQHPSSGTVLSEEEEEEKGLVGVKQDEPMPLTRLRLKQVNPLTVGGKYHLTFSGNLKIWKNSNGSGEVTADTEFEANGETILYVEALSPSSALNDQEVALHWKDEEKEITDGDVVNLTAIDVKFADPESWIELEEKRVVLSDEKLRLVIQGGFKNWSDIQGNEYLNKIKLMSSATLPGGIDLEVNSQVGELVSGEVRIELGRAKLKQMGLLPNEEDGIEEKSWFDTGSEDPNANSNLSDGEAFGSGMSGQQRGRCTKKGNLESNPPNSPLDFSFIKAGGVELVQANYGGGLVQTKWRQVMNQANTFYFSGHGSHATASFYGTTPDHVKPYWDQDLETVIIAGCSVLDINDYNNNFDGDEHNASPGKKWGTTGPKIFLGYNYEAPLDTQGSAGIISDWISYKGGMGEVLAWREANSGNNGRNACAIDGNNYYYYKKILPGIYQWTSVPKGNW